MDTFERLKTDHEKVAGLLKVTGTEERRVGRHVYAIGFTGIVISERVQSAAQLEWQSRTT